MRRLGFSYFLSFPPVGCKGGLTFCWRPGLCFEIVFLSGSIFHLLMKPGGDKIDFWCSMVYGPPLWRHKEAFLADLMNLGDLSGKPWVCIGDFNDVVRQSEKRGGRLVDGASSWGLKHFMDCMGFVDLGYSGRNFTWTNRRSGLANIWERLDRCIANVQWRISYPNARVHHFSITNSDHVPLILPFFGSEPQVATCFKFETFGPGKFLVMVLLLSLGGSSGVGLLRGFYSIKFRR